MEVKLVKTSESEGDASRLDFDADGVVGFGDFVQFVGRFGLSENEANFDATFDIDSDGIVGFSDFLVFARGFGKQVGEKPVALRKDKTSTS